MIAAVVWGVYSFSMIDVARNIATWFWGEVNQTISARVRY